MDFGKYRLIEKIGQGGMAEVFFAQIMGAGGFTKEVALKRVLSHLCEDADFVKSFIDEARLGGLLNHHHIVQTLDFGNEEGIYYLAMEYVHGLTLREILSYHQRSGQSIPPPIILDLVLQLCDGLRYAHKAEDEQGNPLQMVHRDLKPTNILVSSHGVVKIADFGIARAETNLRRTTFDGVLKGTAQYMSPEQAMGDLRIDRRSDIFSVGSICYELITLKPLFYDAQSSIRTLRNVQDAQVDAPLAALGEELPFARGLVPILQYVLARNPADRPSFIDEIIPPLRRIHNGVSKQLDTQSWMEQVLTAMGRPVRNRRAMGTRTGIPVSQPTASGLTPVGSSQNLAPLPPPPTAPPPQQQPVQATRWDQPPPVGGVQEEKTPRATLIDLPGQPPIVAGTWEGSVSNGAWQSWDEQALEEAPTPVPAHGRPRETTPPGGQPRPGPSPAPNVAPRGPITPAAQAPRGAPPPPAWDEEEPATIIASGPRVGLPLPPPPIPERVQLAPTPPPPPAASSANSGGWAQPAPYPGESLWGPPSPPSGPGGQSAGWPAAGQAAPARSTPGLPVGGSQGYGTGAVPPPPSPPQTPMRATSPGLPTFAPPELPASPAFPSQGWNAADSRPAGEERLGELLESPPLWSVPPAAAPPPDPGSSPAALPPPAAAPATSARRFSWRLVGVSMATVIAVGCLLLLVLVGLRGRGHEASSSRRVTIDTVPGGAEVSFKDARLTQGRTPFAREIPVGTPCLEVSIRHDGYEPLEQCLPLTENGFVEPVVLKPSPRAVDVVIYFPLDVDGLSISVDGWEVDLRQRTSRPNKQASVRTYIAQARHEVSVKSASCGEVTQSFDFSSENAYRFLKVVKASGAGCSLTFDLDGP